MISKAFRIPPEDILLGKESKVTPIILMLGFSELGYDVRSKEELALPWEFLYGEPQEETDDDYKTFLSFHLIQITYRCDT